MKIVFVHGALVFDGAWWWSRMVEPLAALGLGTRAVELPSCVAPPGASGGAVGDMYADADAVRAALEEEDEPVVLVGHSYVVCAEDRATPPEDQRAYAKRAGRVVELPTGHHPMLSRPELLARVLAETAATTNE